MVELCNARKEDFIEKRTVQILLMIKTRVEWQRGIKLSYLASLQLLRDSGVTGLFGFLTSSSTTRLYRGSAPRQSV